MFKFWSCFYHIAKKCDIFNHGMDIYGQEDQNNFPLTELLASKRTTCFQEKRTTFGVFF